MIVAATLALAACRSGGSTSPTTSTAAPTTTEARRPDDGVLRLGVLLPASGDGADIGEPLVAVIERAGQTINAGGGINGRPVRLFVHDEGPDLTGAVNSVVEMVEDEDVDAIVGPGSSTRALSVLGRITDAGVVACSPTATAASLAAFPDDGLFFRTVASDELEAEAIARVVDETGLASITVAYPDDPFGRPFSTSVAEALTAFNVGTAQLVPYDPLDDDFTDDAAVVVDTKPKVVVVLGAGDGGVRMATAVATALPDLPAGGLVLNDALASVGSVAAFPESARAAVRVVAADPFVGRAAMTEDATAGGTPTPSPSPAFAAQAIDCVNLIALAATAARSNDPTKFKDSIQVVSRGGQSCGDFPTCAALIASGLNADYEGPTGFLGLDANGDAAAGQFVVFGFDDAGLEQVIDRIPVTVRP